MQHHLTHQRSQYHCCTCHRPGRDRLSAGMYGIHLNIDERWSRKGEVGKARKDEGWRVKTRKVEGVVFPNHKYIYRWAYGTWSSSWAQPTLSHPHRHPSLHSSSTEATIREVPASWCTSHAQHIYTQLHTLISNKMSELLEGNHAYTCEIIHSSVIVAYPLLSMKKYRGYKTGNTL